MEIKDYRERKDAGAIEIKALDKDRAMFIVSNYHPGTGRPLPSQTADLEVKNIEAQIEQIKANIKQLQELEKDAEAMLADINEAGENFEKGQTILGKNKSK